MIGRASFVLLAAAVASGCGGDGDFGMTTPSPGPTSPTFTQVQETILTPRCALAGCHAAPSPAQGMDLSAGASWSSIVEVPSTELAAYDRVRPADPAASYLYLKIVGDVRIVGERMPFGGPYLSPQDAELVRAWIAAGARND